LSGFAGGGDILVKMSDSDLELLARYTRQQAEDAFAEIVRRHLDLVFSAALRQVRSPQLAEEVAQSAFTDLARQAHRLAPDTVLTAWLYQVTRRTAIDVVRREARRQVREQVACELNAMNATASDWTHIEPLLDDAMQTLEDTDRTAVLLRYFENKSLREVGQTLGTNEDAARKRVSRAVERLREFFAKRGVTVGASGLVVAVSANAVQAAPAGLAVTISAAALAGTTLATTVTATKAIAMTALQKILLVATLAIVVATPLFVQHKALTKARAEQSPLFSEVNATPVQTPTTPPVGDIEDRTRRDRQDLERLRGETQTLRARISELSTQAQRLATANSSQRGPASPIGERLRLADVHDAGQATPAALLQTHVWAMLHGDTNRLTQLMVLSPETDVLKVQRMFEALSKEATKGMNKILAETPLSEIRLLEDQPAEDNERWIVHEFVANDGSVTRRARIRVRPTGAGWKLVIGLDGQIEEETVGEAR
jgi:RNA polymerase sigma factor (sigma-70 family)